MMTSGMTSANRSDWSTPQMLFDALNDKYGPFTLDPCASPENAKCAAFFTEADDGLTQPWSGRVFMNPPYGRQIARWMQKAWEESQKGVRVVCLVPARTDTAWWHEYAQRGEIKFIRGRIQFGDSRQNAPFPSAVVVFWEEGIPW